MSYEEARTHVLKGLPRGAVGAEIGVWRGDFSARILETGQPRLLHLVDPWAHSELAVHAQSFYGRTRQPEKNATGNMSSRGLQAR